MNFLTGNDVSIQLQQVFLPYIKRCNVISSDPSWFSTRHLHSPSDSSMLALKMRMEPEDMRLRPREEKTWRPL
jgi:hypothetical protein